MERCIIPSIGSEEVIEVRLTPYKYPIAFKNKVDELLEQILEQGINQNNLDSLYKLHHFLSRSIFLNSPHSSSS